MKSVGKGVIEIKKVLPLSYNSITGDHSLTMTKPRFATTPTTIAKAGSSMEMRLVALDT